MTVHQVRETFLRFFQEKGHIVIPSASLIPENDPTVLFTTAGMQPLVPYLSGNPHPMGKRLVNSQKCLRTDDIEEVGDNRHLTFFEMLGNWSLGDYFKTDSIAWSFELLTDPKLFNIDPNRLFVSIFEGDADASRDDESVELWKKQFATRGIDAVEGKQIFAYPKKKNWWPGPTMKGLCGPDTEIFYDTGRDHDSAFGEECHPNCECGKFVEIWNNVFMQFHRAEEGGALTPLPSKNVDTGMGLERMTAVLQGVPTVFDTDAFQSIFQELRKQTTSSNNHSERVIADHIRASVFVIGDSNGVVPSNVGQGYIVRRLMRRAIREGRKLGLTTTFLPALARVVIDGYGTAYPELQKNAEKILSEILKEEEKFALTLDRGMKKMLKLVEIAPLTSVQAVDLYQTDGFPIELTEEIVGQKFDATEIDIEMKKHQDLSRTASAGMFKGGLADDSPETTRLHTATHLLHRALKTVLGDHVEQKGSNITSERLRFDFSHGEKMTPDQITEVEQIVNDAIRKDYAVSFEDMTTDEAEKSGALGYFKEKYASLGGKIKVYTVGDSTKGVFSKEICGGPHVHQTAELGSFKIQKEEAVSAGVRRIKATVSGPDVV